MIILITLLGMIVVGLFTMYLINFLCVMMLHGRKKASLRGIYHTMRIRLHLNDGVAYAVASILFAMSLVVKGYWTPQEVIALKILSLSALFVGILMTIIYHANYTHR